MNRMIGTSEDCTSSITAFSRFSNSPLTLAPACISPTSSMRRLMFFSIGGTSPSAIRSAKPSTTAVLPTPASPVRIGLFWRRRIRMSMIWRISGSRPITGSILPSRARWVRSVAYFASAESPPGARLSGASASAAASAAPPPASSESARHLGEARDDAVGVDLVELAADLGHQPFQDRHLEAGEQDMAAPDLLLAEFELGQAPALLDGMEDVVGELLDGGGAARQLVDGARQVGRHPALVDAGIGQDHLHVGALGHHQLLDEVHQLDIGVAAQLGGVRCCPEGALAERVELAHQLLALEALRRPPLLHADMPPQCSKDAELARYRAIERAT